MEKNNYYQLNNKKILTEVRKRFGNKKIVVRSSASCEDSILFTNSGQYDSFLNLISDDEILSAIDKTFNSFVSTNAIEYYKINNINIEMQAMAVLIQEVAPVKIAGVMFTADPLNGKEQPILEYCNGLGENVVSGQKNVITIRDNYDSLLPVFRRLLNIGKKIEYSMGCPQDIEWGIDENNNIYIFQSRPIVFNKRNIEKMQYIELPNSYIIGSSISRGFTIGQIKDFNNCDYSSVILQNGKLTSKDLKNIISSKGVLLQTGGYLSHFANIIREFNKPSLIIDRNQLFESNKSYIIDGYNGYIYKFEDLNFIEQRKVLWNYFVDLVCNGNCSYLNLIGIKDFRFMNSSCNNFLKSNDFIIVDNKIYIRLNGEMLEIEFISFELVNEFLENIFEGGKKNVRIYRRK